MKKSIYILYHGNCYDGFGAAFAAWLRFTDDAIYIPVNYGQPIPPEIDGADEVYIVDFSYPRVDLERMAKRVRKLVVLDHHHTAEQALAGLELGPGHQITFNMAKSGAVLAWEYFHGSDERTVPEFFMYLQDRDLWTFALPQSREVSMALRSYPFDFKVWSDISGLVVQGQIYELPGILIDNLKKEGIACKRLTDQQVDLMARHPRRALLDGKHKSVRFYPPAKEGEANDFGPLPTDDMWCCPVANATVFFSEVGERLLELYPDAPFAAYYLDRKDGKRQWGLRSRPEFDCSVIATAFGGGGHKQAAGFVQDL